MAGAVAGRSGFLSANRAETRKMNTKKGKDRLPQTKVTRIKLQWLNKQSPKAKCLYRLGAPPRDY